MNVYIVSPSLNILYFFLDDSRCNEEASDLCVCLYDNQHNGSCGRITCNHSSLLFSTNSSLNNHLLGYRGISRGFWKVGI